MIRVEQRDATTTITLDRPQRGNALDRAGVDQLRDVLDGLDAAEIIVIQGAAGRAFCGGADAPEMISLSPRERQSALQVFLDCSLELWRHPALTVARVNGYAIGGGAHLALACDLRVMTSEAWFEFPSSAYGLHLGATWLRHLIGYPEALRLLASATRVHAHEAHRLGLVQAVLESDGVDPLQALGLSSTLTGSKVKAAIRASLPAALVTCLEQEFDEAVAKIASERFVQALARDRSASSPTKDRR